MVYPGYPKPRSRESEAAFRFCKIHDLAHIDEILPHGPTRRRKLIEPHALILGVLLNECAAGASLLVVWPTSPDIICRHLTAAFLQVDAATWVDLDITAAYQAAQQEVFATWQRLELHVKPGKPIC